MPCDTTGFAEIRPGLVEIGCHPGRSRRDMSGLVKVRWKVMRSNARLGDSLELSAWAPRP